MQGDPAGPGTDAAQPAGAAPPRRPQQHRGDQGAGSFIGRSLRDLNLRKNYNVSVLAAGPQTAHGQPPASHVLNEAELLVVMGSSPGPRSACPRHMTAHAGAGLMSGTSADGVDAVLASFSRSPEPAPLAIPGQPYTPLPGRPARSAGGRRPGQPLTAASLLDSGRSRHRRPGRRRPGLRSQGQADLVGCHGQTLWHRPRMGSGAAPAGSCCRAHCWRSCWAGRWCSTSARRSGPGRPWRPAGAGGGRGPAAGRSAAGGPCSTWGASPTSPCCLPPWARTAMHRCWGGTAVRPTPCSIWRWPASARGARSFDADGGWGRQGRIDEGRLRQWLQEPYFQLPPPKSTGRELFGPPIWSGGAGMDLGGGGWIPTPDALATLTAFSAAVVAPGSSPGAPAAGAAGGRRRRPQRLPDRAAAAALPGPGGAAAWPAAASPMNIERPWPSPCWPGGDGAAIPGRCPRSPGPGGPRCWG